MHYEKAWAAGFFDGEGYIGVIRGRQVGINITQTDPTVLERFQAALGVGKIYGPYTRKSIEYKPCWYYQVYGFERCQHAVCQLWPWLSPIKRSQAKAALIKALGGAA